MICDRCDQLMRPVDAEPIDIHAATGPGATVYIHKEPCTRSRAHPQSYPDRPAR
ncbi:hypothetical protein ACIQM0_00925 [Streptomyces sp. NPDC091387]|uniref:hypothetical protein n=1 Tax=Streptomyces sp. NPDC091387 TaxID=3365998 RepID=UPI003824CE68